MAVKQLRFTAQATDAGRRLDQFLADRIPEFSRSQARKLIVAGAVYLNNKRVRIASKPLRPGAQIRVALDRSKVQRPTPPFVIVARHVLHEDEHLIAIDKPVGVPSQPTLDEARTNVFGALKKYLNDQYVGLHHRLDKDTSGVMVFSKSQEANAGLAKSFSDRLAQKTYLAICHGRIRAPQFTVKNFLGLDTKAKKKPKRYCSVRSGGQVAETEFEVLNKKKGLICLQVRPKTGRTHQIRVHLAEAKLPILGDRLYGQRNAPRMMLHAWKLTLCHPLTGKLIELESPPPEEFAPYLEK